MIVVVFGLPGSGKSFFASKLSGRIDAEYKSSDMLRHQLQKTGLYSEKDKEVIYKIMRSEMESGIRQGRSIVVDATFYKDDLRNDFINLAGELRTDIIFIEIKADEEVIRERVSGKRKYSEADFEVYLKIKEQFEPMKEPHLILRSGRDNIDSMLEEALEYINQNHDRE